MSRPSSPRRCPVAQALPVFSLLLLVAVILSPLLAGDPLYLFSEMADAAPRVKRGGASPLRFRGVDRNFKILQVADMHFGNGAVTRCRDVPADEAPWCSDLNTTQFLRRFIAVENPDFVVFTGDNIFGASATDAAESLFRVFSPVMEAKVPWAAILGNHDQESTMSRQELMAFISLMDYSQSQPNPPGVQIDGYGNYHVSIHGPYGSDTANKSILNLYFLDSGDRAVVGGSKTYGWIRESQHQWLHATSQQLQLATLSPALAFFHIPIPEVRDLWYSKFVGQYQEGVACSKVNSGTLNSLLSMGDVRAVFLGHDHLNDFCGAIHGVWFCYGGGFGYGGYGRAGWPRRGRIILAELDRGGKNVETITTWKRLDNPEMTMVDKQVLWRGKDGQ